MKRGTPRHKKMYKLAEALKIPLPYAVGIMEMLWHYAGENTPRGDIGSQPAEAIKQACGFHRKAVTLVNALADSRWLDRNDDHRFILHDWPDHCEQSVVKLLHHRKHDFLPVYGKTVADRMKKKFSQSLEIGYPLDKECLPSRGAEAEAKEDFEFTKEILRLPLAPVLEINPILDECEDLYTRAGRPFPTKHRDLAAQYLVNSSPESWPRLPAYIRWALGSIWADSTKTKGFINLLRDGDWNVPIVERTIPAPIVDNKRKGMTAEDIAAL